MSGETLPYDILVTGAGAVGSHAVEFLARRPEVKRIAVIDVRKATAEGLAWRARIGALQEDKDVVVTGFALDLLDRAALEETLAAIRPRVVFHAATLLTVPEMYRGLKPEVFERVRRDGMGGFLAAHICLAAAVQAGLAAAGSAAPLIVASFPDFTIPVLARMGRTPITGIGNVDNMASELQSIAAERLGVWARDVTPMIVAHHSVGEWFQRSGNADKAPWFARVFLDGHDVTERFDTTAMMVASAGRLRGVPQEARTAASGVKAVLAVLTDAGRYLHAAGALGKPGGRPARLYADRLELVPVPGLDEVAADAMNLAGQRAGGVESIEADGTIVYTQTCASMMRELFGLDLLRVRTSELEATGRALRQSLTRRIASGG